jgi:5S rRNA maturation endonuclease (ribonuclease M5)
MNHKKSLEEFEKALIELREDSKKIPIIVEGEKDIEALKKLGISGKIITVNSGITLIDFCDKIAREFKEIIILTDWDRKGGFLCSTIKRNLEGRVVCNLHYREIFAKYAMIKTVEGLPSWFMTMNEKFSNDKID